MGLPLAEIEAINTQVAEVQFALLALHKKNQPRCTILMFSLQKQKKDRQLLNMEIFSHWIKVVRAEQVQTNMLQMPMALRAKYTLQFCKRGL